MFFFGVVGPAEESVSLISYAFPTPASDNGGAFSLLPVCDDATLDTACRNSTAGDSNLFVVLLSMTVSALLQLGLDTI